MPEAGPAAVTGVFMGCLFTFVVLREKIRPFWAVPLKSSLRKWMCLQQRAWDSVPGPQTEAGKASLGEKWRGEHVSHEPLKTRFTHYRLNVLVEENVTSSFIISILNHIVKEKEPGCGLYRTGASFYVTWL